MGKFEMAKFRRVTCGVLVLSWGSCKVGNFLGCCCDRILINKNKFEGLNLAEDVFYFNKAIS